MKLRYYQADAIAAIYNYFMTHVGNPVVAMPTGTGKSIVIGEFVRSIFHHYPGQRVMMLTHVKELIEQNLDKLLRLWPTAPAGVFSAGMKRREAHFPVTFGGVATVAKASPDRFGRIDLLLIDECHLLSPHESTMYQVIIKGLREINPALKVVGFTATDYRLGWGRLTEGNGLFTDVCFDLTGLEPFNRLVAEGYLAPLIPKRTAMEYDVSGVKIHGGEYKQNELQAAVDKNELTYKAIKELVECGQDRNHWLVFASGVEHAEHVRSMLDSFGIAACVVHSKLDDATRKERIDGFKSGKYRAAVNNNVLTTGFDFPGIDLIGMLRPTSSPSLWVQMLGRGTRPVYHPDAPADYLETMEGRLESIKWGPKQNCLVLDFAGNTRRLGPINDPVIPKPRVKGGGGVAPVKVCEACGVYNHASVRFCSYCGAEFPKELKIRQTAYTDELMASGLPQVEVFKVDRVTYMWHEKPGRLPSMQVSYFCGLRMFREWICFEHSGFPKHKAHEWWKERSYEEPPELVSEALLRMNDLKVPTHIRVWLKPKNSEVMGYDFHGSGFGQAG